MIAPREYRRETSAEIPQAKRRRAASLKGHRTRRRMAAAREREQQRRDDELTAERVFSRLLGKRLLWPSSYRLAEDP